MMSTGTGTHRHEQDSSAEDLGEDIFALASVVAQAERPASILRRVNGRLVRVIVEAA